MAPSRVGKGNGSPMMGEWKKPTIIGYQDNNHIKINLVFILLAHGLYLHILPIRISIWYLNIILVAFYFVLIGFFLISNFKINK
jgi:hypothetical protein